MFHCAHGCVHRQFQARRESNELFSEHYENFLVPQRGGSLGMGYIIKNQKELQHMRSTRKTEGYNQKKLQSSERGMTSKIVHLKSLKRFAFIKQGLPT